MNKNETTENFPVAQLIRPALRPHVMAFYHFVRAGDEIADAPLLEPQEKIKQLDAMAVALQDETNNTLPEATALRQSLKKTGVTPQHALDLLHAFKQDATKRRYDTWKELLDYCNYSANPVGRYMLALHGIEEEEAWESNDALCTILQITNHLQDCGEDYRELDRIYIPLDMMEQHGTSPEELAYDESTPALRDTIDAMLQLMEPMMILGRELPFFVPDKMLRLDTAVISVLAESMIDALYKRDPLCENAKPSKGAKILAIIKGIGRAFL
ncbi:MAG: squalene synthase HpnC [Bdellovibrionales bacterium]